MWQQLGSLWSHRALVLLLFGIVSLSVGVCDLLLILKISSLSASHWLGWATFVIQVTGCLAVTLAMAQLWGVDLSQSNRWVHAELPSSQQSRCGSWRFVVNAGIRRAVARTVRSVTRRTRFDPASSRHNRCPPWPRSRRHDAWTSQVEPWICLVPFFHLAEIFIAAKFATLLWMKEQIAVPQGEVERGMERRVTPFQGAFRLLLKQRQQLWLTLVHLSPVRFMCGVAPSGAVRALPFGPSTTTIVLQLLVPK